MASFQEAVTPPPSSLQPAPTPGSAPKELPPITAENDSMSCDSCTSSGSLEFPLDAKRLKQLLQAIPESATGTSEPNCQEVVPPNTPQVSSSNHTGPTVPSLNGPGPYADWPAEIMLVPIPAAGRVKTPPTNPHLASQPVTMTQLKELLLAVLDGKSEVNGSVGPETSGEHGKDIKKIRASKLEYKIVNEVWDPREYSRGNTSVADFASLAPGQDMPAPPTETEFAQVDLHEWYPVYQSCLRFFLDQSQHTFPVQSLAAFINIRLPCQRGHQADPPAVSLRSYVRRLVVTSQDTPAILCMLFGDDWLAGVGCICKQERLNYLFSAKSGGWASTKSAYDILPDEQTPFLRPLRDVTEEELRVAESRWSEWLAMEDWMLGSRSPW